MLNCTHLGVHPQGALCVLTEPLPRGWRRGPQRAWAGPCVGASQHVQPAPAPRVGVLLWWALYEPFISYSTNNYWEAAKCWRWRGHDPRSSLVTGSRGKALRVCPGASSPRNLSRRASCGRKMRKQKSAGISFCRKALPLPSERPQLC